MEWIILFVISWILFIILVDWKDIIVNIWCGILAMAFQIFVDSQAIAHKLYKIDHSVVEVWGSSLFFVFGPVFVIGILFSQYHPKRKWMKILNIIVISGLFSVQEILLIFRKVLIYTNWHFIDSVTVNVSVITLLSWFSIVILNKGVERKL